MVKAALEAAANALCRNRFGCDLDDKAVNEHCRQALLEGARVTVEAYQAGVEKAVCDSLPNLALQTQTCEHGTPFRYPCEECR